LNWLLEGTARWKRERLKAPPAIFNATDEYRGEMDVIGNFLKECCIHKPEVGRSLFFFCFLRRPPVRPCGVVNNGMNKPISVIPCMREWAFLLLCYCVFLSEKPF
jgi:hypothetical protein